MPKKYGVKEKDLVVSHVVNLILTGKLRSGDRVDRNEIAHELGLSRVPIQEAVVQLEHDGILFTRYHRGAFVEVFDEAVVREHHEVYGLLNGVASARAAADGNPELLDELERLVGVMHNTRRSRAFNEAGWHFRQLIKERYAGPRLLALIQASQALVPEAFWSTYMDNHDEMLVYNEREVDAIRRGDLEAARAANVDRSEQMAQIMLAELVRRGVLSPSAHPALHSK
ncbi:GntR family transcriptional regulator [Mycolicibacterium pulveris]|uniref:GntR family transcriptional regulator n=1 Tax=Mycolicibacterium pulveris TaxID=36813 RepID=UPI003CEBD170